MPSSRLTAHFLDLCHQAALASFWTKKALKRFLLQCGVPDNHVATMDGDETKREYLDRLLEFLGKRDGGESILIRIAGNLREQTSFPDLKTWEDSENKIKIARQAVAELNSYLIKQEQALQQQEHEAHIRNLRAELSTKNQQTRARIEDLNSRFNDIGTRLGSQKAGYEFEQWFYDLIDFFEIPSRRPYKHDGRQIDGSVTLGDTTYLVELKFTANASDATDVDTFLRKVTTKADNTMGIMVSMSGYSSTAIKEASGPRTPLLLMDFSHVLVLLRETMTFREMIERLRRHSSQTGKAYLPVNEFG